MRQIGDAPLRERDSGCRAVGDQQPVAALGQRRRKSSPFVQPGWYPLS